MKNSPNGGAAFGESSVRPLGASTILVISFGAGHKEISLGYGVLEFLLDDDAQASAGVPP